MLGKLRFVKRLVHDLPKYSKLAYCLLRDDRVPAGRKAAFGAAIAVGLNPFINLPEVIPVVGELDALAVTLLAIRVFIASSPDSVVEEHRRLIDEERSRFDLDLRSGEGRLGRLLDTVTVRLGSASGGREDITEGRHSTPTNKGKLSA